MDMMEELGGLTRGGGNGGGHHVFGAVTGYKINPDSNVNRPNHNDRILLNLQRPALGFDASQENPVAIEVAIEAPKPTAASSGRKHVPLGVIHVQKGRGSARPTGVGDFLMVKDVRRSNDGSYVGRRVEVGVRGFDPERHYIRSGLFSVRPERETRVGDQIRSSQNRLGLLTEFADVVKDADGIRERSLQALADAAGLHGARPFFVLRGIQMGPDGGCHFSVAREVGLWDNEKRQEYSPEEAIERFLSGEDGQNGPKILQYVGRDDTIFEVIPQFRVSTGQASLPSYRRQEAIDNGRYDPSQDWKYDDGHAQRFMERDRVETGYSNMDVVLQRVPNDEVPGAFRPTHTIFAQAQRPTQGLFKLSEVITPNLPASLVADLNKKADERAKSVRQANKAKKPGAEAAPQAAEQDESYAPAM